MDPDSRSSYCDRTLLHLLKTFIDITLLRKGPEDVPSSTSVLLFALGLLICAFALSAVVAPGGGSANLAVSFFVTAISYVIFWLVLLVTGFSRRLVPTIASIMACGSILTLFQSLIIGVLSVIATERTTATIVWLIAVWGIPVKGNIIARAIEQHWFAGIAIAMSVFVLQYVVYFSLAKPAVGS